MDSLIAVMLIMLFALLVYLGYTIGCLQTIRRLRVQQDCGKTLKQALDYEDGVKQEAEKK